jgi:hypothetical protein
VADEGLGAAFTEPDTLRTPELDRADEPAGAPADVDGENRDTDIPDAPPTGDLDDPSTVIPSAPPTGDLDDEP